MIRGIDHQIPLAEPFPFQIKDAEWLASKEQCFLGNEMRVGKTPAVIRACDTIGANNILILCPASVRVNWMREFGRFSPLDRPIQAVMPGEIPRVSGIVIVSFDMAVSHAEALKRSQWDVLVIDEAHALKERTTRRTKAVYGANSRSPGIIASAKRTWRLSGTPCPNFVNELWTHLRSAGLATESYWDFTFRYCTFYETVYGCQITGNKNVEELKARIAPFMLRRTLAEVMPELPPVVFETVTVQRSETILPPELHDQIPQLEQKDKELQKALSSLSSNHQIDFLESTAASITTLRRYVLMLKLSAIAEQLEEDLNNGIEKLVVFCIHTTGVEWLAQRLKKFNPVTLYGPTPATKRQENIDQFKTDPNTRIFIGNLIAAGVGIDLTPCIECVFLECSFVPGDNSQAVKRLQGVNQKFPVRVRIFTLYGSVDEQVTDILVRKTRELAKIF